MSFGSEPHVGGSNVSTRGVEDLDVAAKSRIVSKRAAELVDQNGVLAATGESRLESVRQLIMRGMKITSFEPACAARLRSLTVSARKMKNGCI